MEEQTIRQPQRWTRWELALLVIALLAMLLASNRFYLTVEPVGEKAVTVEFGEDYQDPGARAALFGTVLLRRGIGAENLVVTAQGQVDTRRLGEYTITYTARLGPLEAAAVRTVTVVDTQPPQISLNISAAAMTDAIPYKEEGFRAVDNCDGDITHRVTRQELFGRVVYTVEDSSGNLARAERKIPEMDHLAPTILLEGGNPVRLCFGREFEEPGYVALDNVAGDLTRRVEVTGEVDPFTPGEYTLCYRVEDDYENIAQTERTVQVVAQPRVDVKMPQGKVIYLTFDDGPGPHTEDLLELLDRYGVKATFFVTDSEYPQLLKKIVEAGHAIGIHTVSHDYAAIYASMDSYFEDLLTMQEIICRHTGVMTTLMRFPGGSSNMVSRATCPGLMTRLTQAVQDAGFQYFDWNVDSLDAGGAVTAARVAENVIQGVQLEPVSLVLQHDIHDYSVSAVEQILNWGLENGYRFLPLQEDSPPFHHPVLN